MDQYVGKMLDNRYELLELIGSGGMANVYKTKCHRLNRLVAVKILKSDLAQDAEFRRRFRDESLAVAKLSHANIMSVYDVSSSQGIEYIVMELLDGITLKQYMERRNHMNWREALHFITQIVKALGHAHSRGIIHRDIKPHNIMVLRDGSVKVTDFGIARLVSANHSTLTQEALGSVHYISPEQARGSRIDSRSDLYSAGVVLYEMITGRLPFEGDSPVSVAIQHINSIPLSPRDLNPEIPEALEAITMKAMASNPDDRYISADEMLAALEEFRKNPNINFDYHSSEVQITPEEAPSVRETEEMTQVITAHNTRDITQTSDPGTDRPAKRSRKTRTAEEYDDDYYDDYDQRRGPVWPIFLAVVAILGFTVGVFYFLYTSFIQNIISTTPDYKIPNLLGKVYEEVVDDKSILQDFGLLIGSTVKSEEPVGTILKQSPDANTGTKDASAVITVTISSGPETFNMPQIDNADYYQVVVMLRNMGLSVSAPESRYDDEIPSNRIISYSPAANTVLRPGDTVHLVVSKGPEPRESTLITLVGQTEAWARNKLATLGLEVGAVKYLWNSEYKAGIVSYQSIAAGTTVLQGTKVSLQISKGVDPSTLPEPLSRTLNITLPLDPLDVQVTVMEGNNVVLDKTVNSALDAILPCTVSGHGTVEYEIYFDGVLQYVETVNFSEAETTDDEPASESGVPSWIG